MFLTFEKAIFQFFASFWLMKLKPVSGKVKQSVQDCLNQNFVIASFLENSFDATWSSKANIMSVWKEQFTVFCRFLSGKFESNFWEREAKRSKLFKSKFGHKKLLIKWFWSYVEFKNESSECLKRKFFNFLQVFEWRSWNHFLGKRGKC